MAQNLPRFISRLCNTFRISNSIASLPAISSRRFSANSGASSGQGDGGNDGWAGSFGSDDQGWDQVSSWSTGMTKDHFDGEKVGRKPGAESTTSSADGKNPYASMMISDLQEVQDKIKELEQENRKSKAYVDGWSERLREVSVLLKQVILRTLITFRGI